MEVNKFQEISKTVFGDKIYVGLLKSEDIYCTMDGAKLNLEGEALTKVQEALGVRVWVPSTIPENGLEHALGHPMPCCPNCGAGLFGNYVWDIQHGQCGCTGCYSIGFSAYHYEFKMQNIAGRPMPIIAFEVNQIGVSILRKKGIKIDG